MKEYKKKKVQIHCLVNLYRENLFFERKKTGAGSGSECQPTGKFQQSYWETKKQTVKKRGAIDNYQTCSAIMYPTNRLNNSKHFPTTVQSLPPLNVNVRLLFKVFDNLKLWITIHFYPSSSSYLSITVKSAKLSAVSFCMTKATAPYQSDSPLSEGKIGHHHPSISTAQDKLNLIKKEIHLKSMWFNTFWINF